MAARAVIEGAAASTGVSIVAIVAGGFLRAARRHNSMMTGAAGRAKAARALAILALRLFRRAHAVVARRMERLRVGAAEQAMHAGALKR
jgi:hypothetical protein